MYSTIEELFEVELYNRDKLFIIKWRSSVCLINKMNSSARFWAKLKFASSILRIEWCMARGDEDVNPLIKLPKWIRMFCTKHASQEMIIRKIKLMKWVV